MSNYFNIFKWSVFFLVPHLNTKAINYIKRGKKESFSRILSFVIQKLQKYFQAEPLSFCNVYLFILINIIDNHNIIVLSHSDLY